MKNALDLAHTAGAEGGENLVRTEAYAPSKGHRQFPLSGSCSL